VGDWIDYGEWRGEADPGIARGLKVLPRIAGPDGRERHLLVWLPPSYERAGRDYPVIYMHDGQNLFDAATSYAGSWEVGSTMERLSREGFEAIVVGVPNARRGRIDEYAPFRDRALRAGGGGDAYLEFLAGAVKPRIDAAFRTRPAAAQTALVGSSVGGLISLYGFFARPETFGLAGALSPSLRLGGDETFRFVRDAGAPRGRIYLDVGTREADSGRGGLAAAVRSRRHTRAARRMRDLLIRKGYRPGADLLHVEARGDRHHESAWGRRLPGALRFLYGRGPGPGSDAER
jgi:predicted alpha/beta superfamily hydrolase